MNLEVWKLSDDIVMIHTSHCILIQMNYECIQTLNVRKQCSEVIEMDEIALLLNTNAKAIHYLKIMVT